MKCDILLRVEDISSFQGAQARPGGCVAYKGPYNVYYLSSWLLTFLMFL